ncbi:MAG: GTPase HflX [Deltaproteobacteria bacterium]|jgi:GTP-binding protein HflX|nr:GTPase HflX [Deltaproteobacteria bacterium]
MKITGNTTGLKKSQKKKLKNLAKRRVVPFDIVSKSLADILVELAEELGRETGVFLDRKGKVVKIILGEPRKLSFPELEWSERGRLAGVRLVHAHPVPMLLQKDDLTNLVINRLDLSCVLFREDKSSPLKCQIAHSNPDNTPYKLDPVLFQKLDFNFITFIRDLEEDFAAEEKVRKVYKSNQAILVVIGENRKFIERRVSELKDLAYTAGVHVDDIMTQVRNMPDNNTLVGKGKLQEIILSAKMYDADILIFDPSLTPAQASSISQLTDLKIIDRTMLILDIFAQRAKSSEGKIQVELALLKYSLPHLVGKNTMMSRLEGGIGGRGPGETKLEVDRRRVKSRINRLEKRIDKISRQRSLRRKRRKQNQVPVVSVIGYTNAGKSTLLNMITGSDVLVEDRLFATLDPSNRRVRFPENIEIIMTDTVGFIEDLPPDLQKAFRATLEELDESDLLIHLVDISDPDYEHKQQTVENIISEMKLDDINIINVYNKVDKLDFIPPIEEGKFFISALNKETTIPLINKIKEIFNKYSYLDKQDLYL